MITGLHLEDARTYIIILEQHLDEMQSNIEVVVSDEVTLLTGYKPNFL